MEKTEVQRMAEIIDSVEYDYGKPKHVAEELQRLGFGDKKQAVEEFVAELEKKSGTAINLANKSVAVVLLSKIKETLKEMYGE